MTRRSITRIGLLLAAALTFSACGNANPEGTALLKQLPNLLLGKKPEPRPVTPQQIATALSSSTASLFLVELERNKSQVLLQDVQRNGPYQTYGNAARNVVVMRDGMITSTRGLGGDLMSSEEDGLHSRVRARAEGTVSYDQRFLTPEDVTIVRRYTCRVTTGGTTPISGGLVQTTGYVVTAACTAADGVSPDFTNTYAVSQDGYVLSAKQWAGPFIGHLITQVLRR
ncbi:YjbF family lipoprotein [Maliponia aquimaris]|uniref:Group 4 capsule polysaccharide lipoprotein gfcB, YjbF n=1 Tax=Maliponia aquimaris TaxID=1673631 RepID=A0A238JQ04_9RHOB|nr:YjbF family lipoprotein [Maliponia aquimaris]SMX32284.1 hypothetical protein MAA8898_00206 [Maliponia aquimaris]